MARSGKENWLKYWNGNDGLVVFVKKTTNYYETETSNKSVGTLSERTQVTYRDPLSQHINGGGNTKIAFQKSGSDDVFYAPIDNFVKPGRISSIDMKPEAFGLANVTLSSTDYYNRLINSILDRWDSEQLSGELYDYLTELVQYANGGQANITGIRTNGFPWGAIQSYFGEVIGPLACVKRNLLSNLGINVSSASIMMPPSSEALYDYKLISGNNEYKISAKSGRGVANQVKPQLVLSDQIVPAISSTLKSTQAYRLLTELKDNSVILGAFKGYQVIQPTTDGTLTNACISDVIINYTSGTKSRNKLANKQVWAAFVQKHLPNTNLNNATYGQVRYKCEKLIENASKTNSLQQDLKSIFEVFLNESRLIYVKLAITLPLGTPRFEVVNTPGVRRVNSLMLRTSNDSQARTSDRIGFDKVR